MFGITKKRSNNIDGVEFDLKKFEAMLDDIDNKYDVKTDRFLNSSDTDYFKSAVDSLTISDMSSVGKHSGRGDGNTISLTLHRVEGRCENIDYECRNLDGYREMYSYKINTEHLSYSKTTAIKRAIVLKLAKETKNFNIGGLTKHTNYGMINRDGNIYKEIDRVFPYGSDIKKTKTKTKTDTKTTSIPTTKKKYKADYDLTLVNVEYDLNEIVDNMCNVDEATLLVYGVSGTGKSAFAKHLANKIGREIIIKKGSDLLSKWVGDSEKAIAQAFKEASDKGAVLVFDEVDTFLIDRTTTSNNWENSQINEMLTQMEDYEGIFIATTNLVDNLDSASMRRFDLKMEFKYMLPEQIHKMFTQYCNLLGIAMDTPKETIMSLINECKSITGGDFNVVARQSKFFKIKDDRDFIEKVIEESKYKKLS